MELCLYLILFMTHSEWNNGVTLKSGFDVTQGHWKWHCLVDDNEFFMVAIVSVAVSCTIFELFDIEIYLKGDSTSLEMAPFESLGTVWFPIRIL